MGSPEGERRVRHLRVPLGGLQVGYKLQIRPRTTVISKKIFSNHRRPSPERKSKISLRLDHAELCGFHRGDGGCEGMRDDCVDGDDIFDTGGAPENIVTTVTIVTAKVGCA